MQSFDEMAKTWDNPQKAERAVLFANEIRNHVPELSTMSGLEFGCGTGLLSVCLQPYIYRITLVDSSQGMIEVAKQKIGAAGFTNLMPEFGDMTSDHFIISQKFDIIFTLMALHHVADTNAIIGKFAQLLPSNGFLCIGDLEQEDGSFHGEGFAGHNGFNRSMMSTTIEAHGFVTVCSKTFCTIKKNENGAEREYPAFCCIAKKK